jgi:hypothetical protein
MPSQFFLVLSEKSVLCRPTDLRHAPEDPDAAEGALLVQLLHETVQGPLQKAQTIALESGRQEQAPGEVLHPGSEGLVIVTVKRGMPENPSPGAPFFPHRLAGRHRLGIRHESVWYFPARGLASAAAAGAVIGAGYGLGLAQRQSDLWLTIICGAGLVALSGLLTWYVRREL